MPFSSECEAVRVLQENFNPSLHCQKKVLSTREFTIGFGIADLVFFDLSTDDFPFIQEPVSTDAALSILNLYQNGETLSTGEIVELGYFSINTVRSKLRELVELGYLEADEEGYRKKIEYNPIVHGVVAIEVKLSNWKRALIQAFKYTIFANQSYVAMDAHYVHRAEANIGEFKRGNIGLLSIAEDGAIEKIYEPTWQPTRNDFPFLQVNEKVKALM